MVFICVICMIKDPPLLPLSAEHRQLLEAIVSPAINTTEIKHIKLLLYCVYCNQLLQSVYNFQQTALKGVKAFIHLLNKHDGAATVQAGTFKTVPGAKPDILPIKDEPEIELETISGEFVSVMKSEEVNPLSEEVMVKIEPVTKPEPVASDCESDSTISCDSCEILDPGDIGSAEDPRKCIASDNQQTTRIQPNTSASSSQLRVFTKKSENKSVVITVPKSAKTTQAAKTTLSAKVTKMTPPAKSKIIPLTKHDVAANAAKVRSNPKLGSFDVFTHRTQAQPGQRSLWTPATNTSMSGESKELMSKEFELAKKLPYLTSIRWKGGVEEGYIKDRKERPKPPPVSCPHCDKVLSSKGGLKIHLSLHGEATPLECKTCGEHFRSASALKTHRYKHKLEIKSIDDINPELFCKDCSIHFACPSSYKTHLTSLKHTPKEKFIFECETCKKKFPSEKRRQDHIDFSHLHKRKHKCDACDKAYGKRSELRIHVARVHDGVPKPKRARTHVCHLCGKAFTVAKSLQEHFLSHQGLRPYQCKLCPATFSYKAVLYNHNKLKHLKIKGKRKKKKVGKESGEVEKELSEVAKELGEVGKESGEVGKESGEVAKEWGEVGKEPGEMENELSEVELGSVEQEAGALDVDSFLTC